MSYKYTEKDLDLISWDRIDEYINKIYSDVKKYLDKNNLGVRYISPILRGGGIPAIILSHMFNCIDMLPIQLKYNSSTKNVDLKMGLDYLKDFKLDTNECILLVEGNHVTGKTANIALNILKEKFGNNINVIYVSITRDYSHKDSVKDVCYTTCAMYTNETKKLSKEECNKLGIDYNLVSVYPWENVTEELFELNKS